MELSAISTATAISTASATILSLGLAFVGLWAWGPQSSRHWERSDLFVLAPALIAFVSLGLVPWVAWQSDGRAWLHWLRFLPSQHAGATGDALNLYLLGVLCLLAAIFAAFVSSWLHSYGAKAAAVAGKLETAVRDAVTTAVTAAIKKAVADMSGEIKTAAESQVKAALKAATPRE
jgi:high-affinity Fe2+/Pb2+ permease